MDLLGVVTVMLEAKVEAYLVATTELRGGWCAKMIDAGRRGAPDRELRMPGGKIYFIELKKPKGSRFQGGQEGYHQRLRDLNFYVDTLYTIEAIDSFWTRYDRLWDHRSGRAVQS